MAATLLDAGAGSRARFAAELLGLVRHGLRSRATRTAHAGATRLVADGLCLAAIWTMTLDVSTLLAQRARGISDPLLAPASIALIAVALGLALVGFERVAGVAALLWAAQRMPSLLDDHVALAAIVPELLPIACFALLALAPRRRALDPRRLAWLIVPVVLVATLGPGPAGDRPLLLAVVALATLGSVAVAVVSLPLDPRLAIAGAVPLSSVAAGVLADGHDGPVLAALLVAVAPLVVAAAFARTRGLARAAVV